MYEIEIVEEYLKKFFSEQLSKSNPLTFIELSNLKTKKDIFGNKVEVGDIILFCMIDNNSELELVVIIKRLFNSESIELFNRTYHCINHSKLIPYFKRKSNGAKTDYRISSPRIT